MRSFVLESPEEEVLKNAICLIFDSDKSFRPDSYMLTEKNGMEISSYKSSCVKNQNPWTRLPFTPTKSFWQNFVCDWVFSEEAASFFDAESVKLANSSVNSERGFRLSCGPSSIYVRPIFIRTDEYTSSQFIIGSGK
jgi:hypothetical protein